MHKRFFDKRLTWGELRVGEDALAFQARHEELLVGLADQPFSARPKRAGVTERTAQVRANGSFRAGMPTRSKRHALSSATRRREGRDKTRALRLQRGETLVETSGCALSTGGS